MGFGKTNPNSISENKVLHFFDGRDQWIQRCKKITFAIVRFFLRPDRALTMVFGRTNPIWVMAYIRACRGHKSRSYPRFHAETRQYRTRQVS
jgi:hypothetical protein